MKYKTVVIDPPWNVQCYAYPEELQFRHRLTKHVSYDTMKMDELLEFDIDEFAEAKCLLFLWATTGKTFTETSSVLSAITILDT